MDRAGGFDEWYEQTRPGLVRSLLVVASGDLSSASEAADEALVRALERWPRVRTMDSPAGWTHRVALNVLRRRHRRRATEDRAVERLRAGAAEHAAGADGEAIALWDAVADLDRRSREVIALRYVAGMTEPEIADLFGTRPGTVSSILSRARARLRDELGEAP